MAESFKPPKVKLPEILQQLALSPSMQRLFADLAPSREAVQKLARSNLEGVQRFAERLRAQKEEEGRQPQQPTPSEALQLPKDGTKEATVLSLLPQAYPNGVKGTWKVITRRLNEKRSGAEQFSERTVRRAVTLWRALGH